VEVEAEEADAEGDHDVALSRLLSLSSVNGVLILMLPHKLILLLLTL
jgi:hypothetical protein